MEYTNNLKSKFDYGPWGQQYTPPFCYELAGCDLDIRFETEAVRLQVLDRTTLIWHRGGTFSAEYWALKLCNDIYMVSFGLEPEICVTLVIDMNARLVTLDETSFDENHSPYRSALCFGAIAVPDLPLPEQRHCFTEELAGNCFRWVFCDTYWHVEGYEKDTMFYRSNYADFHGVGPYRAVKISDTVYYTCNGDAVESMSALMDISRLFSISRSIVYGKGGKAIPLGAIGFFSDGTDTEAF